MGLVCSLRRLHQHGHFPFVATCSCGLCLSIMSARTPPLSLLESCGLIDDLVVVMPPLALSLLQQQQPL